MMAHKICFNEEIWIIIPKLSLLLLLIRSTEKVSEVHRCPHLVPCQKILIQNIGLSLIQLSMCAQQQQTQYPKL